MTRPQIITFSKLVSAETDEGNVTEWHHGCCRGSDAQGSIIAVSLGIPHIVGHPGSHPAPDGYQGFWDELLPAKGNLERDEDIAKAVDLLFATPRGMHESVRQGTWVTVRRARKHNTRVTIIWPDGTFTDER